jgi:hypothetical protein
VYLAVGLRNAGNGIAVLHGWRFHPEWHRDEQHSPRVAALAPFLSEFPAQPRVFKTAWQRSPLVLSHLVDHN